MYQTITLYQKSPQIDTLLKCFDQANAPNKVQNLFMFYEKCMVLTIKILCLSTKILGLQY